MSLAKDRKTLFNKYRLHKIHCILLIMLTSPCGYAEIKSFEQAAAFYRQKDYNSAFSAFTALAAAEDARAQTVLALMYKFGEGTEVDLSAAFNQYSSAATLGYAPAQFHAAIMLLNAQGTEKDIPLALSWLEASAKQGFERAISTFAEFQTESLTANSLLAEAKRPVTWSNQWDFRLPNKLRDEAYAMPMPTNKRPSNPGISVQIGAMTSLDSAKRLWEILKSKHTALFNQRSPSIKRSRDSEKPIYRLFTGPFSNLRQAKEFCARLVSESVHAGCLPVSSGP